MNPPAGLYFGSTPITKLTFDYLNLDGESTSGWSDITRLMLAKRPSKSNTQEFIVAYGYTLFCPKEYMFWMD